MVAAYLVFGWLVLQIADIVFPALGLPEWTIALIVVLLAIGFIPALIVSWVYELTPEGLKRESEVDHTRSVTRPAGRKLDLITIAMLVLVLAVIVGDRILLDGQVDDSGDAGAHEYSIPVLPFQDLSDTQDQKYFSHGISEELLNKLAKVESFRVAGRTSSFAFEDRPDDLRVIGDKLNVATILEGSVRKAGDQLRITAQLINVADGYHLWSETYDRRMENIFAIQDEIAESVVSALQVTLMGVAEPVTLEATVVADTRAYELYLKGRHQLWKRRREPLQRAEELFEQATAIDSDYAPAYAGLSDALQFQVYHGYAADPTELYTRAESALDRALSLDPRNSNALASLGILRRHQGRNEEARNALELAIAHNPNNAQAHTWLANTYSNIDPAQRFSLNQKGYAIDPLARVVINNLFWDFLNFGRSDEARSLAREMHSLYPESGWGYQLAGHAHNRAGHRDAALKSYYRAYQTAADRPGGRDGVPWVLINLSEFELADAWLAELKKLAPGRGNVIWQQAALALQRGEPKKALRIWSDAAERYEDPAFDHNLGWAHMMSGDFAVARKVMEQSLLKPGQTRVQFDPDRWPDFIDYVYILQRTGAPERAAVLIAETKALLEAQLAAGVEIAPDDLKLQFHAAQLHAMSDNPQQAMAAMRRAVLPGGVNCTWCLHNYPHFDSLRGDAAFTALIAEQEAKVAAQRQRLAAEEMLLTPQQVLELEGFTYDPFDD